VTATTIDPQQEGRLAAAASLLGIAGLLLALPIVLLAGVHIGGWFLGAGLWLANWGASLLTTRVSLKISAPAAVGVSGISFIARAWMVAIVLFVVALRFSEIVALTAAAVFLAAFTLDLAGRALQYGLSQQQQHERQSGLQEQPNE